MKEMTSMQRVVATISGTEPDRVPLFLLFSFYGAKELGTTIKDYFSNPDNIVEAQVRLRQRYHTDCFFSFSYASIELEAMGGTSLFYDDGPPNAGRPIIRTIDDIDKLWDQPSPEEHPRLQGVLHTIRKLKHEAQDDVPIISVGISPFSLPVMQLGFEKYLNVLLFDRPFFNKLMEYNEVFFEKWATAQINAGSTAICYFDPVSSPSIVPPALFASTGFEVAQRSIKKISGVIATHLASGRCIDILDSLALTGTKVLGVSSHEDLTEVKKKNAGRLTLLGNLNGIEMCRWDKATARARTREAILKGGPGGQFILSENHGEIPWYVKPDILEEISNTATSCGHYPLIE